jgi:hypothetical protein
LLTNCGRYPNDIHYQLINFISFLIRISSAQVNLTGTILQALPLT